MTVPRSPLSSPVKRPTSLGLPDLTEELLKKPVEDVEAGLVEQKKPEGNTLF